MNFFKVYRPIVEVFVLAIIAFAIHKVALLSIFGRDFEAGFQCSLQILYLFFGGLSLMIIAILNLVHKKSIDSVGQTFMLLTCIKTGAAFWFGQNIMSAKSELAQTERINFFIVFAVFLTVETIVTIRLLNKTQRSPQSAD